MSGRMEKTEKTLKIIKPFLTALKKQGLEMARLACLGREYRYSPEKGLRQTGMEPVEIDFPEPVKPEKAAGRYPKEKKMPSYRLTLVLLFVAMVLFIGIIFLNQRLSRKDMEPVEVVNPSAGESASGILIPEKENEMAGDEMNQDRPASDGQRPTGEDSKSKPAGAPDVISGETGDESGAELREKKATPGPTPFQEAVSIRSLSPELIESYHTAMNILRIDLPRKISASGTFNIDLYIDKSGKVYMFRTHDSAIEINPDSKRDRVILQLKQMISGLQFKPPRDRSGRPVRVENWRLNFLVTQFKRRLILRKQ
jgi:hypothetical protein